MTLKPEHIVEALNKKTFDEIPISPPISPRLVC